MSNEMWLQTILSYGFHNKIDHLSVTLMYDCKIAKNVNSKILQLVYVNELTTDNYIIIIKNTSSFNMHIYMFCC